ncbi:hypothetical protein IHN63_01465 [Deinococcus sp. 6YEL10]|uniref:hypothetical protein n=1 Tax=Deinococcus sp. 6YEL10 TaxID=2745870 RepID=UPI001E4DF139|nr:hypothetical protein [Deinococcus sp. 6YEL10]MCD0159966.1 hypothetical protein [Deinococcus sp. 6YEL10]
MTEPRFHAAPDIPDAPETSTRWWLLDTEAPGLVRAEFLVLPSDVATAEELARETARQMNLWHQTQVKRAAQLAVIYAWADGLNGNDRDDLYRAVQEGGNNELYPLLHHLLDR